MLLEKYMYNKYTTSFIQIRKLVCKTKIEPLTTILPSIEASVYMGALTYDTS